MISLAVIPHFAFYPLYCLQFCLATSELDVRLDLTFGVNKYDYHKSISSESLFRRVTVHYEISEVKRSEINGLD